MSLHARVTIVLSTALALLLVASAIVSYRLLFTNADREVHDRASLMLEAAMAMRHYTIHQVRPRLHELDIEEFVPQTVPSYGATQLFASLREQHAEYTYRETALNPTNPINRPADWERDVVSEFRNHDGELSEIYATRNTPTGEISYIARPIKITDEGCLACHSTPERAPSSLIKSYGENNGFGWNMNEVVGAQIVSVPTEVTYARANRSFYTLMSALAICAVVIVVAVNLTMRRLIIRPVQQLADHCDAVSKGNFTLAPLPPRQDEIGTLSVSFERMKVSLQKAMALLDDE